MPAETRLVCDEMSCLDVFTLTAGIYVIHAFYFQAENASDFDEEEPRATEAIQHYVVYNAGTRVLNLLSEVSTSAFVCPAQF